MTRILFITGLFILSACSNTVAIEKEPAQMKVSDVCDCDRKGGVNTGTETAVVKVFLDKKGIPYIDMKEIELEVGQRVVWVGPQEMTIRFPKMSPFKEKSLRTRDAVVNRIIPKQDFGKREQLRFKYDVIVGKQVLDPILIVRRPLKKT